MNKHEQTREALLEILSQHDVEDKNKTISISLGLLEDALTSIDTWKMIGEEFGQSITVTPGEIKPRIAVDIERFLAAQFTFKQEADGI